MAGTGEMLDEMKVYALDHGFREKILFPGFVDFHKAIEYYKKVYRITRSDKKIL